MSVAGLSATSLFSSKMQSQFQEFKQEFQQLGQDLQSGNLSAAQSDFATLQQLAPQSQSTSSAQSSNPIAQAFEQLSQDLQAGNTSAAQQDFATIQQDFQNLASQAQTQETSQTQGAPHHHHNGGEGQSAISQLFAQLGQALQSGNLSTAQQVYSTMLQDFSQNQSSSQSSSNSSGVSVSA
jgi:outer membrane protein assembly factor BamD (BamD/ComL family)